MKRLYALLTLLAFCLVVTPAVWAAPTTAATGSSNTPAVAPAAAAVSYLDETGKAQTCTQYTALTADTTQWTDGWLVVSGQVTLSAPVTVTGDVKLILSDGAQLDAPQGITLSSTAALTLYAQSTGAKQGILNATATAPSAPAIGGESSAAQGALTICGGTVNAVSSTGTALAGQNISILGGTVKATGGTAISGQNVTVQGGTVTAHSTADADICGTFSTGKGGNALLYVDSIEDSLDTSQWSGLFISNTTATAYGKVTLAQDLTLTQALWVDPASSLTVNGTLTAKGAVTNGGSLTVNDTLNAPAGLDSNAKTVLTVAKGGSLQVGGSFTSGLSSTLQNNGTLTVNGTSMTVRGTLTNSGAMTLQTPNLQIASDGRVENTGTLTVTDPTADASGVLTNQGTLENGGTLVISQDTTLTNAAALQNDGTLTVDGTLENAAKATLQNDGTLTVGGALDNSGTLTNGKALTVTGTLTNNAKAALQNTGSLTVTDGTVENAGTLTVTEDGSALLTGSQNAADCTLQNTGALTVDGALELDNATLDNAKGTAGGSGSYLLAHRGVITPQEPEGVTVEYRIFFEAGKGKVDPTSVVTTGKKIATLPVPTRKGYTFDGWFTAADAQVSSGATFQGSMTLTARWHQTGSSSQSSKPAATATPAPTVTPSPTPLEMHTIHFNTNGGYPLDDVTFGLGAPVELWPYAPARPGYLFAGWYTDEALTQPVSTLVLVKDTTLYAKWNVDPVAAAAAAEAKKNSSGSGSGAKATPTPSPTATPTPTPTVTPTPEPTATPEPTQAPEEPEESTFPVVPVAAGGAALVVLLIVLAVVIRNKVQGDGHYHRR